MTQHRLAAFTQGVELHQSDASPNGVITPLAIAALCVVQLAGSVALWQCTALPSTWVNVSAGGTGVPLSSVTASLANTTIDNRAFTERMSWSTLTTQVALTLDSPTITSGNMLKIASTSLTQTGASLDISSSTTGALAQGLVHLSATAAHTGALLAMDTATLTGVALQITAPALTSGQGLAVVSSSVALTGQLGLFQTASTAAVSNGLVRINATGAAMTGNCLQIDSAQQTGSLLAATAPGLTTGVAASIGANALTTGTGLSVSSSSAGLNSTLGLLSVVNSGASTTGILARLQSSSAAGSGLTVLCNGNTGLGTVAPVATLHNAGSTVVGMTGVGNLAGGGSIGSAATTVDAFSGITCAQTTAAQTLTLPNPTNVTAGRRFIVSNTGSVPFAILTIATLAAGASFEAIWTGAAWSPS